MSRESFCDPAEGEFVDFETLDDWRERDEAKNARIAYLEARVAAADKLVHEVTLMLSGEGSVAMDMDDALAAYEATKEPSE